VPSRDKTPTERPKPSALCPFCRKRINVTPAGLFALHVVVGRWSRSMCRGGGQVVRSKG